jgi:hypothetical protein
VGKRLPATTSRLGGQLARVRAATAGAGCASTQPAPPLRSQVGPVVACHLLAELGDVRRFQRARQAIRLAGLDLAHRRRQDRPARLPRPARARRGGLTTRARSGPQSRTSLRPAPWCLGTQTAALLWNEPPKPPPDIPRRNRGRLDREWATPRTPPGRSPPLVRAPHRRWLPTTHAWWCARQAPPLIAPHARRIEHVDDDLTLEASDSSGS